MDLNERQTGENVTVFFYGLFMDADALHRRGFNPSSTRLARLEGYALRIGERATLVQHRSSVAYGILMTMPWHEIERLYSDPGVADYRPEQVSAIQDDGTRVVALCYNLPGDKQRGEANATYVDELISLAARIGLPDEYVAQIGSTPP